MLNFSISDSSTTGSNETCLVKLFDPNGKVLSSKDVNILTIELQIKNSFDNQTIDEDEISDPEAD